MPARAPRFNPGSGNGVRKLVIHFNAELLTYISREWGGETVSYRSDQKAVGHYPPHPVQGCGEGGQSPQASSWCQWFYLGLDIAGRLMSHTADKCFSLLFTLTCQLVNLSTCQSLQLVNLDSVLICFSIQRSPLTVTPSGLEKSVTVSRLSLYWL